MKICLVTPFGWSQPHDVNEHVAGIANELRALGHSVTVLAPSARTADLIAGRRALARGEDAEVIAIAGNHDHPAMLDAYRPLAGAAGITLAGAVASDLITSSGGLQDPIRRGVNAALALLGVASSVGGVRLVSYTSERDPARAGGAQPWPHGEQQDG